MALTDLGTGMLRRLDPETAHHLAIRALRLPRAQGGYEDDPILATTVAGITLSNPIGLAAGLDKNAEAIGGLSRLGFGFIECGSVTPRPQAGNPRPRLFRLSQDRAIINRMGFNNDGLAAFRANLLARGNLAPPVGANLGANKDTEDRAADYVTGLTTLGGASDYFTVNISSPNTPGLRALQSRAALDDLLGRVAQARPAGTPVFLKIAPDLMTAEIGEIVEAALIHGIDALIVSNTTLERPSTLRSSQSEETGGLSGAPLAPIARRALVEAVAVGAGRLPLIAVGGIGSGADVLDRIKLGATAVQIYSALVFAGPGLVARVKRDLAQRLRAEGFSSVAQAVGTA